MRIGICGYGFIGNAINMFFKQHEYIISIYDKYKNINTINCLFNTDILYICLPTPYNDMMKTYDMAEIDSILDILAFNNYSGVILIKSTIIPTYCNAINEQYNKLYIMHNPEFLSAKTAVIDFSNQSHIIIGYTIQSKCKIVFIEDFYRMLFPKAIISITSSEIAGMSKLACNSFYSVKIQFMTEIYNICNKLNIPYNSVKELMLNNGWINKMHTSVPGSDNMISFGGMCLPKDINALNQFMIANNSENSVIDATIIERNKMRID